MLSGAELSQLQAEAARSMPDECYVIEPQWHDDGAGGQYEGEPSRSGPVACRKSPSALTPTERVIAERAGPDLVEVVTLPAGTPVSSTSRIEWQGREFEVIAPLAPRSWEITRRVLVKAVKS